MVKLLGIASRLLKRTWTISGAMTTSRDAKVTSTNIHDEKAVISGVSRPGTASLSSDSVSDGSHIFSDPVVAERVSYSSQVW